MRNPKKIYILNTGGTISMKRSPAGYVPARGFVAQQMAQMSEFQHPDMPHYTIDELDALLDSANMRPADWCAIGGKILANYDHYDGFVILHGTDTMSYTASALSFMLENLGKPVILTGSQIPLAEVRNDARDNLINAMLIAANYAIPEVCIYFNARLLRGNRTQKINANAFTAFASPRFATLGRIGIHIEIHHSHLQPMPKNTKLHLQPVIDAAVCNVRLFPGISANILKNSLQPPLKGLILETYGTGNAPNNDPDFLQVLREAAERGVIIVNCTQCQQGSVDMTSYATGSALKDFVISGLDMTPEAALTKLAYLLNKNLKDEEIRKLMQESLRGELAT